MPLRWSILFVWQLRVLEGTSNEWLVKIPYLRCEKSSVLNKRHDASGLPRFQFFSLFLDDEQARFGKELRSIYGNFMRKETISLVKMDDLKENEVNLLSYDRETGTKMQVTTTFKVCTELDKMDFYSLM